MIVQPVGAWCQLPVVHKANTKTLFLRGAIPAKCIAGSILRGPSRRLAVLAIQM